MRRTIVSKSSAVHQRGRGAGGSARPCFSASGDRLGVGAAPRRQRVGDGEAAGSVGAVEIAPAPTLPASRQRVVVVGAQLRPPGGGRRRVRPSPNRSSPVASSTANTDGPGCAVGEVAPGGGAGRRAGTSGAAGQQVVDRLPPLGAGSPSGVTDSTVPRERPVRSASCTTWSGSPVPSGSISPTMRARWVTVVALMPPSSASPARPPGTLIRSHVTSRARAWCPRGSAGSRQRRPPAARGSSTARVPTVVRQADLHDAGLGEHVDDETGGQRAIAGDPLSHSRGSAPPSGTWGIWKSAQLGSGVNADGPTRAAGSAITGTTPRATVRPASSAPGEALGRCRRIVVAQQQGDPERAVRGLRQAPRRRAPNASSGIVWYSCTSAAPALAAMRRVELPVVVDSARRRTRRAAA